ncbi:30S ribosomal protein S1 [Candidatus Izimaplasma bacterium HR1]|jgi:small subunit ribosomal protein S1|uniref:S1 RNA-binding domain-containing protein n=1 Tax=Candidatus Izimoplasma sp. HR1 TaxID=1541959 RepID=UPI0004F6E42C|nr:30S ribosomal protein S1 [Candidatus Izimaplasma bacterium HR1]
MEFKMNNVKVGRVVEGTVFQVNDDVCYVDLGAFADGLVNKDHLSLTPIDSCKDVVKEGDVLKFKVSQINYDDQRIILSRLDMLRGENRMKFDETMGSDVRIKAKVTRVTRGGLQLRYNDIELFMPASHVDVKRVELEDFEGKVLECKIIENDGRKVVVSRKLLLKEDAKVARKEALENIKIGDKFDGTVTKIMEFGAFVNIGLVEGLLHRSEISHYHVKTVSEVLKEGDKVHIEVIKKEKNKIGFSIKSMEKTPWEIFAENKKVGDEVEGTIIRKMATGMLVEVDKEVVGIINDRDYSWNPRENLAGEVEVGSKLTLKILTLDPPKKRMSLSKKHLEYNPWNDVSVKVNEEVSGTVEALQTNGALVKVQGVKAFLPIGEISGERVNQISDVLKVDDVIKALVLEVDKRNWRMKISIKALKDRKERAIFENYKKDEVEVKKQTLGDLFKDKFDEFK